MAELMTIARPYAKAVFELAVEAGKLGQWSETLKLASQVVAAEELQGMIDNPSVARAKVGALIIEICGDKLSAEGKSFIKLLAENGRLKCLGAIFDTFENLRAEVEKTIDAVVISAFEVDDAQQQKITAALKKRLGREVSLTCKVDPSLVGGAIIRAGDLVIDGSAAGQIKQLASAMSR